MLGSKPTTNFGHLFLLGKVLSAMNNSLITLWLGCVVVCFCGTIHMWRVFQPFKTACMWFYFPPLRYLKTHSWLLCRRYAPNVKTKCIIHSTIRYPPARQLQVKLFPSCFCARSVQVALFWQGWLWQASNSSHWEPWYSSSQSQKKVA